LCSLSGTLRSLTIKAALPNDSTRWSQPVELDFITAGESHGKGLVAIIEGLPAGLQIDPAFINRELWRRQQGYGRGARMKIESDEAEILSGVRHGETLGSRSRC
jgi:chorismate synthase